VWQSLSLRYTELFTQWAISHSVHVLCLVGGVCASRSDRDRKTKTASAGWSYVWVERMNIGMLVHCTNFIIFEGLWMCIILWAMYTSVWEPDVLLSYRQTYEFTNANLWVCSKDIYSYLLKHFHSHVTVYNVLLFVTIATVYCHRIVEVQNFRSCLW
jgi:hypothetical protein